MSNLVRSDSKQEVRSDSKQALNNLDNYKPQSYLNKIRKKV